MINKLQEQILLARKALHQQLQTLDLNYSSIQALQLKKLQEILAHAKRSSLWHASRLAHIDLNNISLNTLLKIPPMTKTQAMQHWDQIICNQALSLQTVEAHLREQRTHTLIDNKFHAWATGGSSGTRGVFVWSIEDYAQFVAGTYRLRCDNLKNKHAALKKIRRATLVAENPIHMSEYLWALPILEKFETHTLHMSSRMDHIVRELNRIQPHEIDAFPSMMSKLSDAAKKGLLNISPYVIGTCAEPLFPDVREKIATAWPKVPIIDFYGSSECGPHALNCTSSSNLHLCEDSVIIETVDKNNQPVPANVKSAKILVTSLINKSFPFIRYEIDDELTILSKPCSCGIKLKQIKNVTGRMLDTFIYGGIEIHPYSFVDCLLQEENVSDYQVVQTSNGADIAIEAIGNLDLVSLKEAIVQKLVEKGLAQPTVSLNLVGQLPRHPETGKFKRFVAL